MNVIAILKIQETHKPQGNCVLICFLDKSTLYSGLKKRN